MARLPTVGGDYGNWGTVLNEYLSQAHKADGTLRADVASIAALKAIDVSAIPDKMQVMVGGYYAHGDGGGGEFYYDAAASEADNGGTTITPTSGSGRWKRAYSGAVNVKWFGAKGDGATNDAPAVQSAVGGGGTIIFPSGTYQFMATITLPSNTSVIFRDGASVSVAADNVTVFYATGRNNITLHGVVVAGGGSATTAGVKRARGIHLEGCSDFHISDARITDMGVMHATVQNDTTTSGSGIIINGTSTRGVIERCRIERVAGGGINGGDGIYVGGAGTSDIAVRDCYVSTCGRHCYAVASGTTAPTDVLIVGCYGEKTGLCGLDIEPGIRVTVDNCRFSGCGNDTTFYNPHTEYGATYRLRAGIAHGNGCDDVAVLGCTIDGCYYGITYGSGPRLLIEATVISSSSVSDLWMGTAASPRGMRIRDSRFLTVADVLGFYIAPTTRCDFDATGCEFTGTVKAAGLRGALFSACVFFRGFTATGSGLSSIAWVNCEFADFAGVGIDVSGASYLAADCVVRSCRFLGAGNMTAGIRNGYRSALRWIIEDNLFSGLTTAGIENTNGSGYNVYASVAKNTFLACTSGVTVSQGVIGGSLSANLFSGITGWCIEFVNISSTSAMHTNVISDNTIMSDCANGIRATVSSGAVDHCIIVGNCIRASGTKLSIAGNANGVSANNIVA